MCAKLSPQRRSKGATTQTLVATHVPPPRPGVTRFYAQYVSVEQCAECETLQPSIMSRCELWKTRKPHSRPHTTLARRSASAAGDHRRGFARRKLRRRGCAPQTNRGKRHPRYAVATRVPRTYAFSPTDHPKALWPREAGGEKECGAGYVGGQGAEPPERGGTGGRRLAAPCPSET